MQVLAFFPFLVSAFHDKFGSYDVNDRMLIYRGVYMEGMENSRRNSFSLHALRLCL